jgi:hypothetical protein
MLNSVSFAVSQKPLMPCRQTLLLRLLNDNKTTYARHLELKLSFCAVFRNAFRTSSTAEDEDKKRKPVKREMSKTEFRKEVRCLEGCHDNESCRDSADTTS